MNLFESQTVTLALGCGSLDGVGSSFLFNCSLALLMFDRRCWKHSALIVPPSIESNFKNAIPLPETSSYIFEEYLVVGA